MDFEYDNIPEKLKKEKRWVLWRKKKMQGRSTKVPINALTGNGAKSNDPNTWTTYEEAIKNAELFRANGVGFQLGNGYFGVDIDHALDNTELINEFTTTLNSYTEVSQSGEGIHIICEGDLPTGARRKGNIEMYDSQRFFALTGTLLEEKYKEIVNCTESIKPLYEKYLGLVPTTYSVGKKDGNNVLVEERVSSLTDEEVIEKAIKSKLGLKFKNLYEGNFENEFESQSEADYSFCKMLAFWCNKDTVQMDRIVRNSGLMRDKWDRSIGGGKLYGESTIIRACIATTNTYIKKQKFVKNPNYNPETGEVKSFDDFQLDDTGNARRFIATYGENIRYECDNGRWYIWNGTIWKEDTKYNIKNLANLLLDEMQEEAMCMLSTDKDRAKAMLSNVKRLASHNGKEAMLKEAVNIGSTPINSDEFDTQQYLLNCKNGIVDLHTGEIHEHDKRFMQTKCTNIDYLPGEPKRWKKYLNEIFEEADTEDRVKFMQMAMGYTLTGDTREQGLIQCYGKGSNGKGVFFDVMMKILGDYAMTGNVESILKTKAITNPDSPTPGLATMQGKRLVVMNEADENARYNEPLLKQLTGGTDKVSVRQPYGKRTYEFQPSFKLWLATNYKVKVRGTDYGIWRRQKLMGFNQTFKEDRIDKQLPEKLEKELSAILFWAVQGCLMWQKEGLNPPDFMKKDLLIYQKENDTLQIFLDENVLEQKGSLVQAQTLYNQYKYWAKNGNEYCMSQTKFGGQLLDRGYTKKKLSGKVHYENIKLNIDTVDYTVGR